QEYALLLSAAELADLPTGVVCHADAFEAVHGLLAFFRAGAPQPAQLPVSAHQDDVEHLSGEVPVDGTALGHIRRQSALFAVGGTVDQNAPGGGFNQAQD